jgi:hypothetical protein
MLSLDLALAQYGPESLSARATLRKTRTFARTLELEENTLLFQGIFCNVR